MANKRTKEAREKTKAVLWAKASGRCQYPSCNELLWGDLLAGKEDGNFGFVAHIVAAQESGPRGDQVLSSKLADDISNLMLLCYRHHHLIDVEQLNEHPIDLLVGYKKQHEERIAIQTSLQPDCATQIVLFGANVGKVASPISFELAKQAILPDRYPAQLRAIELGMANTTLQDHEADYWVFQGKNLESIFTRDLRPSLDDGTTTHVSIFALAPQPLLIVLGCLLTDLRNVQVFQLHREPKTWRWQADTQKLRLSLNEPKETKQIVALKLAISADILNERIRVVLGESVSIWSIEVPEPHNDILKSEDQLREFRKLVRECLNKIKLKHGEKTVIHVFPAVPVACAVEFGRVRMPKADLPLVVYDQNRHAGGFIKTIEIN